MQKTNNINLTAFKNLNLKNENIAIFSSASLSNKLTKITIRYLKNYSTQKPFISWYVNSKLLYSTKFVESFNKLSWECRRTTIYINNQVQLSTPEHLSPVFLLWPNYSFEIYVENENKGEIPLMDGSSLDFFIQLRKIVGTPSEIKFYDAPLHLNFDLKKNEKAYGYVKITPSETFEVEYIIDRKEYSFQSYCYASFYTASDFFPFFLARTFIYEEEYFNALKEGLLLGAVNTSGMLIKKPFDSTNYRIFEEPSKHKILDLLGDLSFAYPKLPRVRIEILNGGHESHKQILKEIFPYLLKNIES